MKKILSLSLITFISIQFQACSLKEELPLWVQEERIEGYITGLGIAPPNKGADIALQRSEAMAVARDDIARQIETKLEGIIQQNSKSNKHQEQYIYTKEIEKKIKSQINMNLRGTRPLKSWISNNGVLYLLMILETNKVLSMIEQTIEDSDNEDDIFLSEKNRKELEKEIEKRND